MKVEVPGIECDGLLDSGSSCTILGKEGLEIVHYLQLTGNLSKPAIRTADGTLHVAVCEVDVPYGVNGIVKVVPTLVIPSLSKYLILGMDFWKTFDIRPKFCSVTLDCDVIEGCENLDQNEQVELMCEQKNILNGVISGFLFTTEGTLGTTNIFKHTIDTGDAKPIVVRPRPTSPFIQKEVDLELNRMLEMKVIEPAESDWANPIAITKKSSGKIRMCLDARQLNDVTVKDRYPLQHLMRILSRIQSSKYISSVDLSDAFWQVSLEDHSKKKTAFIVPGREQFQFTRVPFGLCNSAQSLCRAVDKCLGYDLEPNVLVYIDDLIITSDNFNDHIKLLEEVSSRLKKANFSISKEKSKFCVKELKFLGYILKKLLLFQISLHPNP